MLCVLVPIENDHWHNITSVKSINLLVNSSWLILFSDGEGQNFLPISTIRSPTETGRQWH